MIHFNPKEVCSSLSKLSYRITIIGEYVTLSEDPITEDIFEIFVQISFAEKTKAAPPQASCITQ